MATKKEKPVTGEIPVAKPVEAEKANKTKAVSPKKSAAKKEVLKPAVVQSIQPQAESSKDVVIDVKASEPQVAVKVEPVKASGRKNEAPKAEPEKIAASASKTADTDQKPAGLDRGALFFGGGLFILGVLLLMGRLLQIPFGVFIWPFIFIIPGILVFITALASDSSSGEGLSILGGILTSLGVLFLAQSITGLWASWAYAWALVAPTSIGFSQIVYGERKGRDNIVQSGRRLMNIGLTIFGIGFIFFELILGVDGFGLGRLGLPVFPMLLIFAGLVILVRSFLRNRS